MSWLQFIRDETKIRLEMELHKMEERLHNEEGRSKSKKMRFSMKILFFERVEQKIYLKNYGTSVGKIDEDSEGMNLT
jgi:hypothetical protein